MSETIPPRLRAYLEDAGRLALAFSGGADSAYLLYAARACGTDVRAYYVKTQFQPVFEQADARKLAAELDAPLTELPLDILGRPPVNQNPADRCYHCKQAILAEIIAAAAKAGYNTVIDGTNASDMADDRPGMQALRELRVLSPLRDCGVTKRQLRSYSQRAGLFTWNKPAYACLATRVPTDTILTADTLQRIERAENALHGIGFRDFRVRLASGGARLQVTAAQMELAFRQRTAILAALSPYFANITLDLNSREADE